MDIIVKLTAAVICGLALTACGGGGDDDGGGNAGGNRSGGGAGDGGTGNPSTYTVTPSISGTGGTISPSVAVTVLPGATATFTLKPDTGYTALVSGTCGGTFNGTTYTTKGITGNCTVVAAFASKPLTFMYESQPAAIADATSFLAQINQEGAKGYRYVTSWTNKTSPVNFSGRPDALIFVSDGTAQSYTYEVMPAPASEADFLTQANAEGAKGYRYQGATRTWIGLCSTNTTTDSLPCPEGLFYRKDSGSSATYSYVTDPLPGSVTDFLTQVNGRGQSGYWFYGRITIFDYASNAFNSPVTLYEKNNTSNATYAYEVQARPSTSDALYDSELLAQYNSEGARGYLVTSSFSDSANVMNVYARDPAQAAVYTYQSGVMQTDIAGQIEQANAYGAQGYAYYSGVYVKASNCSGDLLCKVLDWLPPY